MKTITTDQAPAAVGPYSQAIESNGLIFCSGQIGLNLKGELVNGLTNQTQQVLKNLSAVLQAAGSDLQHVIKTTIYLTDVNDYQTVNQLYSEAFQDHKPTRATVEVSQLPKAALIEIDCIAVKK